VRRTQVSQFAWRTDLDKDDLLTVEHPARKEGYHLVFDDKEKLGIHFLSLSKPYIREDVYRPGGQLLAVLLKDVIPKEICDEAFRFLQTVNGDPKNRPGIIGENARQQGVRVSDGKLSPRVRVAQAVIDEYGGKADMLGYYRSRFGGCDITSWTNQKPKVYLGVRPFIQKVDEIYRTFLPTEHAGQMAYVNQIPAKWRIPNTAFTTLYVLKNAPTATHTDDFDYKGGFGCMASLGEFKGGAFCFPRFRVAINYQPGDLILADVHQLHGNFPIYEGDLRVACVFFCREGQAKCPA
jgi:hypothetical protein